MPYTKEDIKRSISNGSFNPRILSKFFDYIKLKSYDYDYTMQKELVNLYHVKLRKDQARCYMLKGAFSNTFNRVYEWSVMHQFLNENERERYKRSDVFCKYVDMETVNQYRKFFMFTLLIIADGKILTNYRMKVINNRIDFCFLSNTFDETIETLDVYLIPCSVMTMLENPIATNFHGTNIDVSAFPAEKYIPTVSKYIGYWVNKETSLGYMIPSITYHKDEKYFTINDMLPTDVTKYNLLLIGINDLDEIADFPADTKWIEYKEKSMPLPVSNMMIFIYKDQMYKENDGSVELTEYYPNLYKVKNENGYPFRIIELYEDDSENEHIVYDNETKRYLEVMKDVAGYSPDSLSEIFLEYKPVEWLYSIDDFIEKHPYHEIDLVDGWDPFIYKMQTISDMLKHWCEMYQEYQKRTFGFLTGWYHNIAAYDNMHLKVRYSTAPDVDNNPDYIITFNEPQYVFVYKMRNASGDPNSYCYYVDGRYTIPTKVLVYHGYQYVYFPCSLIKEDSVIEVERFDGLKFYYTVEVPDEGIEINLKKLMKYSTTANNIFLVDTDGNYLTNGEYTTYIIDPELGEVEVDLNTSVFIVSPECKLKLVPTDQGGKVMVCCNNTTYKYKVRESGNDFIHYPDDVTLNPEMYISKIQQDVIHRMRIFTEDGRLITKRSYNVYKHENFYDPVKFNIPIPPETDMYFYITYTGYDERLIYHREEVPSNGLVNLETKLTRPISFTYHDIYLDGFRLTKHDVDIIAPFVFVIKNIEKFDTLNNLEIYEKCYIPDDALKFEWGEESDFIMDKLFTQDENFYKRIISSLDEFEVSGETKDMDKIRDWWYSFYKDYAPYHYLNGDYRKDLEAYHHIFNKYGRVCLNADDRVQYQPTIVKTYPFDKDKTIEVYGEDPADWPVHEGYAMDESTIIPDDSISVPEEEYRQHGYKKKDYNHVYDMEVEFVVEDDTRTESPDASALDEIYDPTVGGSDKLKDPDDPDLNRYEIDKRKLNPDE